MWITHFTKRIAVNDLILAEKILSKEDWIPTPLLPALTIGNKLAIDLWLKREDCSPTGSFKLRGALVTMESLKTMDSEQEVIVASSGNYGLSMAMAGEKHGIPITVVVPENSSPAKLGRLLLCKATVIKHGKDFDYAKEFAKTVASRQSAVFLEDGVIEGMSIGASTIAEELIAHSNNWDVVLVPIGNGSLIKGIARKFRSHNPSTKIVGLVPEGAPAMGNAISGKTWDYNAMVETCADGLAVRIPVQGIVEELKPLVDEIWPISDYKIRSAIRSLIELEHVIAEPSAAITIAGLLDHKHEMVGKKIVAIITGAHLDPSLIPTVFTTPRLI